MMENEPKNQSPSTLRLHRKDLMDRESYRNMHSYKKEEQADRPHLRKAWSDDESTVTSSAGRRNTRSPRARYLSSSIDDTTILSSQSVRSKNNDGSTPNTFSEWMNYTNKLTSLVSKQIQDCTTAFEEESDDETFKLKDEDFYWNPHAHSFDTLETNKTNEVTTEAFSQWGQNINMWQSQRIGFSQEMKNDKDHSSERRRSVI